MSTVKQELGPVLYELRKEDKSWNEIKEILGNVYTANTLRGVHSKYLTMMRKGGPKITGTLAAANEVDDSVAWQRALLASQRRRKTERQRNAYQGLKFKGGTVCIVTFADMHAGSTGVDYQRIKDEIELVGAAPATYIGINGDVVDNYIIGNLAKLNMHEQITIKEQWAIARHILRLTGPRLLFSLSGNHDEWTRTLSGVDYFREVVASIHPNILYDIHEMKLKVQVGEAAHYWRVRHKWRGSSIYNDTHAIERAAKFDKGRYFDVGIAAHTHRSGVCREFNNGGRTGLAILCGAFKEFDSYADVLGVPQPNGATGVAVIMDDKGNRFGTSNLELACDYMKTIHRKSMVKS